MCTAGVDRVSSRTSVAFSLGTGENSVGSDGSVDGGGGEGEPPTRQEKEREKREKKSTRRIRGQKKNQLTIFSHNRRAEFSDNFPKNFWEFSKSFLYGGREAIVEIENEMKNRKKNTHKRPIDYIMSCVVDPKFLVGFPGETTSMDFSGYTNV